MKSKRRVPLAAKVALGIIGFILWWQLIGDTPLSFGAQEVPKTNNWSIIIYGYIITLVGVILGTAYRELQRRKESGQTQITKAVVKDIFTSIDLWMSLLGSPLVYALLWKSLEGGSVASLTIVALQNGFCCTIIIGNMVKDKAAEKSNLTTQAAPANQ